MSGMRNAKAAVAAALDRHWAQAFIVPLVLVNVVAMLMETIEPVVWLPRAGPQPACIHTSEPVIPCAGDQSLSPSWWCERRMPIMLAAVIAVFAFAGDAAKSVYKRKYGVKNFSNLIPGNGGLLDRFDSLIATGAGIALFSFLA